MTVSATTTIALVLALALMTIGSEASNYNCFDVNTAFKTVDYNVNTGDGFAFWLDDWNANDCGGNLGDFDTEKNDFVFVAGSGFPDEGTLIQYSDHATLRGLIQHIRDSRFQFVVDITFTDRVNPGDAGYDDICPYNDFWIKNALGVRESRQWAYDNSSSWSYYLHFSGTLTGASALAGYKIDLNAITEVNSGPNRCHDGRTTVGFQCGVMANGKNVNYGCSGWFTRALTFNGAPVISESDPAGQPSLCRVKPTDHHGDINVDVSTCQYACDEQGKTYTIGGWSANCAGSNAGCYLQNNFAAAFPSGLQIGCAGCTYTFQSAAAVKEFLKVSKGASTAILPAKCNSVVTVANANSLSIGTYGSQILALSLSVGFDLNSPSFASTTYNLLDGFYFGPESHCNGTSVGDILRSGNEYLGHCSDAGENSLTCVATINLDFDNGSTNNGYVCFRV